MGGAFLQMQRGASRTADREPYPNTKYGAIYTVSTIRTYHILLRCTSVVYYDSSYQVSIGSVT